MDKITAEIQKAKRALASFDYASAVGPLRVVSSLGDQSLCCSLMTDGEAELRVLLRTLTPKARDDLRCVLIRDQADSDTISSRLMRCRDQNGQRWADIIDMLTMDPQARRRVVRLLGEIGAAATS